MDGAASSRREDIKRSKYSQEQLPGGYTPTFIALVFSTLVGGEKKHQRSSINFPNYIEMKKEETIPQIVRHIGEDACQDNFSIAMPRCWLER